MPIYEYECPDCQSRFELRQSFDDNNPVSCPQCQCTAQRLFAPVPVIFKGSGFYVTDNRKNSQPAGDESGGTETKTSDAETKPSSTDSAGSE